MVADQFRHVVLVFRCLLAGVVHPVGIRLHLLARRRGDEVVLTVLQMILQMLYLEGDEWHHLTAKPRVEQVVAQREVEQLALPEHLLGGGHPRLFEAQVVVVQVLDGLRRVLMFYPLVFHRPGAVLQDPLGQRTDIDEPAAMDIHEILELALVAQFLHRSLYGILEGDRRRLGDGRRLQQHQIVVAVGCLLQQITRIVADGLGEDRRREPGTHHRVALKQYDDRIDADALQTGGKEQARVQTGTHFLRQHLVGHTDALAGGLETGRGSGIDDALSTQCLINGGHLGTHPVAVLRLIFIEGRRARQFLKELGSRHLHLRQKGIVGYDERGQMLRHHSAARPLFVRQERDGVVLFVEQPVFLLYPDGEGGLH